MKILDCLLKCKGTHLLNVKIIAKGGLYIFATRQFGKKLKIMGCICSKGSAPEDDVTTDERQKEFNIASVQLTAPAPSLKDESIVRKSAVKEDYVVRRLREDSLVSKSGPGPGPGDGERGGGGGNALGRPSFRSGGGEGGGRAGNASGQPSFKSGGAGGGGGGNASARPSFKANRSSVSGLLEDSEKKTRIVERPKRSNHQRCATMDVGVARSQMSRMIGSPLGAEGDQVAAEWPSWLASVAGEAIKGWVPRRADSYEKIEKVSSCYCLLLVQFFNFSSLRLDNWISILEIIDSSVTM